MSRFWIAVAALLAVACMAEMAGAYVFLPFDGPVPDTISDTGFTDRLPGTGSALPPNDPNLDITENPGFLTFTSTRANPSFTERLNPEGMEAVGVRIPNVGEEDIAITAKFDNIQLQAWSDQLVLYAGESIDRNVRVGFHQGDQPEPLERQIVFEYSDGSAAYPAVYPPDWNAYWIDNGLIGVENGQSAILTLERKAGLWRVAWDNLMNPDPLADGSSWWVPCPGVQTGSDLYVGILYANPRTHNSPTSLVDWFQVVPEPSTLGMLCATGALCVMGAIWRRTKRTA